MQLARKQGGKRSTDTQGELQEERLKQEGAWCRCRMQTMQMRMSLHHKDLPNDEMQRSS